MRTKIEENGAAKEKANGCHKNYKTGQQTKSGRKRPITRLKKAQNLGQKGRKTRAH